MRWFSCILTLIGLTIFSHTPGPWAVQGDSEQGKVIYLKHCAICHGPEGKGNGTLLFDPAVGDLTSPRIQQKSDFTLWQSIHRGTHPVMKSWKWTLSEEEIVMVLAYVRSLGR